MLNNENLYYTGVGNIKSPIEILIIMAKISMILENKGYKLRTGIGMGADYAFFSSISNNLNYEVYSHTNSSFFEKKHLNLKPIFTKENKDLYYEANNLIMTNNLFKNWNKNTNQNLIDIHNSSVFQVLGQNLNKKSKFLICYTKCGSKTYENTSPERTGATGTAINIACFYKIPVFNLGFKPDRERLENFVKKNEKYINYNILNKIVLITEHNQENKTIQNIIKPIKKTIKNKY